MADTPSSLLLLRLQSTGSNTNLWGGYLNTSLQTLEQASKSAQSLTVTGNATIIWANYATGNIGQCAVLELTGTLSTPATLTFPSFQNFMVTINGTGAAVTIMCAGGTGVTLQAGDNASLYCNGMDYFNAAPTMVPGALSVAGGVTIAGQIHGVTAGSASNDAVNLSQMETAIATVGVPATSGAVLNSVIDTTAGYLSQKVVGSTLLQANTQNRGANEALDIATIAYAASGTNAYVATPSPAITAYSFGAAFFIEFANANTGPSTLNLNGVGAAAITKNGGFPLGAGDIPAGAIRLLVYDGVAFQLSASATPLPHLPLAAAIAFAMN